MEQASVQILRTSSGAPTSSTAIKTSKVRVAITGLSVQVKGTVRHDPMLSDFVAPHREPSDDALHRASAAVESAAAEGADLILLPETFACAGMDISEMKSYAEQQNNTGHPHLKHMKQVAQRLGVNIVAGFFLKEGKHYRNTAIVINRTGVLLGRYYKSYLSAAEIAHGIAPGNEVVVVDTDVGRVGLAICFDINWPHHFASVFAKGADFCVWLSTHDGGLPLQGAAMNTRMPILTSITGSPAKVIDCMGRIQAQTSEWTRYVVHDLCLKDSQGMFHIDGNLHKIEDIQRAYIGRVRIRTAEEQGLWTIDCLDAQLSITEIKNAFQLSTYAEYMQHCMELRAAAIEQHTQQTTPSRSRSKAARLAPSPSEGSGGAAPPAPLHQQFHQQPLQQDGLGSHLHWVSGPGYEGDLQDAADSMYQLRQTQLPLNRSSGHLPNHLHFGPPQQ